MISNHYPFCRRLLISFVTALFFTALGEAPARAQEQASQTPDLQQMQKKMEQLEKEMLELRQQMNAVAGLSKQAIPGPPCGFVRNSNADLITRYPKRFLFGSDEVAPPNQEKYLPLYRQYEPLCNALLRPLGSSARYPAGSKFWRTERSRAIHRIRIPKFPEPCTKMPIQWQNSVPIHFS